MIRPNLLLAHIAFFATVSLVAESTLAQQGRFGVGFQQNRARFIPPPRSLNQQLKDAEEAIADKRYSDAVVTLGDLLEREIKAGDDPTVVGQDFFLDISDSDEQRRERSFLRHCRDLIGSLPKSAYETYQLRYGALAQKGLDEATKSRDWDRLREIRRKYFHTQAGYQASLLLAQRELYLGHPLACSLLLDDVVTSDHAIAVLGDSIRALHAAACRIGGRSIPRELLTAELEISLGTDAEPQTVTDWRKWVDESYSFKLSDAIKSNSNYPLLGGDSGRNETAEGQLPLSTPRWMLPTTATPLQEQLVRQKAKDLADSGRLVPPSWTPIRVGNQLLMRTTKRLRGVDYRTGKRVWQYPWFQSDLTSIEDASRVPGARGSGSTIDRLTRSVWNDIPYGQVTSDGKRVFVLDDLQPYQYLQVNPLMGIQNSNSAEAGRNTLVALELETEGKTLWRLGQNPTEESELNEGFFLGTPIAVDGALYAMVELAGDILLVCLAPESGKMIWHQQLVAVEGAGVQHDPIRRITGASPSYHEGVLLCPTGTGATVAVDLADRTLRWGHSYPRQATSSNVFMRSTSRPAADHLLQRWHHSSAVASKTSVLVTPAAADNLYCFELVDGKKRFSKPRDAAFYSAGIRDGQFFLVGPREVSCHNLVNGRINWQTNQRLIPAGQQIVGRGVFGNDCYIVPTSSNELVKIALSDGRLMERRKTRFPLGNLIAIDGEIITQGPTQLAVALGARTLGPRVERMLQENPDDLDALIQKALLLSEQGKRTEALEILDRARRIDSESDDVLMLSITSMLGELRDNPNAPPRLEEELEELIDDPTQRLEFLALRIESAVRNKQALAAVKRLLEFSAVYSSTAPVGNEDEAILQDSSRSCQLDHWLAARAAQIQTLAIENQQTDGVNQILAESLENQQLGSTKRLTSIVRQFRPLGIEDSAVLLGRRFIDEKELLRAERILHGSRPLSKLLNWNETESNSAWAAAIATVYKKGLLIYDAFAAVDSAREALESTDDDGVASVVDEVQLQREWNATRAKVDVNQEVTLSWQTQSIPGAARMQQSQQIVMPKIHGGRTFQGWRIISRVGSIMLQDPNGDALPLPINDFGRTRDSRASISGGLMLLERPGHIAAVDLFSIRTNRNRDAQLWTKNFGGDGLASTKSSTETTIFGDRISSYPSNAPAANLNSEFRVGPCLGDRLLVLQAGDLLAVDTISGETIWQNSNAPLLGHIVVDGGQVAVVSSRPGVPAEVTTFDLLDGRKIGSTPWNQGRIWTSNDRHVLCYTLGENGSSAKVRLVNPITKQVHLETDALIQQPQKKATGRGFGRILQDRYLVLLDSDGRLLIWDILLGSELCSHNVGAMPELESFRAMWMEGQIIVLPAKAVIRRRGDMLTQQGETHRTAHRLIAISTDNGEINWQRDFEQPWGVTIDQPYSSPVLMLARSKTIYTVNRSTPKMDVALIRLTDGKTIAEELEHEVSARTTGLTTFLSVQPSRNRITARIDGEQLQYQFGPSK